MMRETTDKRAAAEPAYQVSHMKFRGFLGVQIIAWHGVSSTSAPSAALKAAMIDFQPHAYNCTANFAPLCISYRIYGLPREKSRGAKWLIIARRCWNREPLDVRGTAV
jgi:hypothetical protein